MLVLFLMVPFEHSADYNCIHVNNSFEYCVCVCVCACTIWLVWEWTSFVCVL